MPALRRLHRVCVAAWLLALAACDDSNAPGGDVDAGVPPTCSGQRCGTNASCAPGPAARCTCKDGFEGDGTLCRDIDECSVDPGRCGPHASCLNRSGSFSCQCALGYELGAAGSCDDIDECRQRPCDALSECRNEAGSFECGACSGEHFGTGIGTAGCTAKARAVAAGAFHSCALLVDGSVKCWGANMSGSLGVGDALGRGTLPSEVGDALAFVDLGAPRKAVALAAGGAHSCALLDDGTVKCWGAQDSGQLGTGDAEARGDAPAELGAAMPSVALGAGALVAAIAAGDAHTCALLRDGRVKCWGANAKGQLGLGDTVSRGASPDSLGDSLPAVALGSGRSAKAIAAGGANSCALLDDDTLKCWGDNQSGQLGTGDIEARGDASGEMGDALAVIDLGTGRHAVGIAVGALGYACAQLDDRSLRCWGGNVFGQLGLGDTEARGDGPGELGDALPSVALGAGRHAVEIALGGAHTCARLDDASVKCWGNNQYATLGLGDFDERGDAESEMGDALPTVDLGTERYATMLAPSRANHSCAVLDGGEVKCWGSSGLGQLGVGDARSRGGQRGEMGDRLPGVKLGHLR